jgi:hypothetical protein
MHTIFVNPSKQTYIGIHEKFTSLNNNSQQGIPAILVFLNEPNKRADDYINKKGLN